MVNAATNVIGHVKMNRYPRTRLDLNEHSEDGGLGVVVHRNVTDAVDAINGIWVRGLPFQRSDIGGQARRWTTLCRGRGSDRLRTASSSIAKLQQCIFTQ